LALVAQIVLPRVLLAVKVAGILCEVGFLPSAPPIAFRFFFNKGTLRLFQASAGLAWE
jgi:hypothetical protein